MKKMLFTSESVTEGHPDKLADQISDSILDAILAEDPMGRVACETLVTTGQAHVVGEISTTCYADIPKIIRQTVREVGYTNASYGFDADTCGILVSLDEQSPDIAQGVNQAIESREGDMDAAEAIGAGDQGMMFGYATNETPEYMPLTTVLAHKLARRLTDVRKNGTLAYLRPDGKTQVTVAYEDGKPVYVDVDDYYSDGTKDKQGRPTLMSIYERAYGKHFGFQDLTDGGWPEDAAMEVSTGTDAHHVDTWGSEPGWFGLTYPIEDHKYDQSEWNTVKSAVDSGQVVVASTTGGDFNNGNKVTAATDTNGDGKIDTTGTGGNGAQSDKEQELTISGNHSYTVEAIDDNYVTLRNPWGNNKHPDGAAEPGGLIRITREDYEKYFARTDISPIP